jgi:hypothetical protein
VLHPVKVVVVLKPAAEGGSSELALEEGVVWAVLETQTIHVLEV